MSAARSQHEKSGIVRLRRAGPNWSQWSADQEGKIGGKRRSLYTTEKREVQGTMRAMQAMFLHKGKSTRTSKNPR